MSDAEFEKLVGDFYQPLYRFALSLSRNEDDAWDLTQQAFVVWARKGHQLRDRTKAKTWLFTTLYRAFLSDKRRSSHFSSGEEAGAALESGSVEASAVEKLEGSIVLEALGELEETFRAPLALFYLQDHSYKEIAEILGVPIGTVMSRLSRGKDLLRNNLSVRASHAESSVITMPNQETRGNDGA